MISVQEQGSGLQAGQGFGVLETIFDELVSCIWEAELVGLTIDSLPTWFVELVEEDVELEF